MYTKAPIRDPTHLIRHPEVLLTRHPEVAAKRPSKGDGPRIAARCTAVAVVLRGSPQARLAPQDDGTSAAHRDLACASHPLRIEHGPLPSAVAPQRALLADGVWALEDPVLPGGEPREDF